MLWNKSLVASVISRRQYLVLLPTHYQHDHDSSHSQRFSNTTLTFPSAGLFESCDRTIAQSSPKSREKPICIDQRAMRDIGCMGQKQVTEGRGGKELRVATSPTHRARCHEAVDDARSSVSVASTCGSDVVVMTSRLSHTFQTTGHPRKEPPSVEVVRDYQAPREKIELV